MSPNCIRQVKRRSVKANWPVALSTKKKRLVTPELRPFAQVHVWRHQIDPSRWKCFFLVWMVKISKHFPRIFQLEREKKNNLFVSTSSRRRWGGGCDDRLVAPCRGVRRRRWGPVFNRIATLIGPGISTARLCSDVSHDLRITFSPKSGRESRPSYLRRRTLFRMKKKDQITQQTIE